MVTIGNGKTATFWKSTWIGGSPLCTAFPALFSHARRKSRTVAEALNNEQWILDLQHGNTTEIAADFLGLWRLLQNTAIQINENESDKIRWIDGKEGCYSASSSHKMQFQRTAPASFKPLIWKVWAPGKVKMFMWLLHHNRLWCNDRLQRRGWPNGYFCPLCL